jgi:hypothetical protein
VLRSDLRGDQSPVLAAVGPMQFEVVAGPDGERVQLPDPALPARLPGRATYRRRRRGWPCEGLRGVEVLQRSDGTHLALFVDQWRANVTARDNPDVMLEALPAGGAGPGTGWSSGWLVGGGSSGPDPSCSPPKSQNQSSPGSKLCTIGCPVSRKCAEACWDGELSQHPTCPQSAQRRRCTHQPPAASHS